MLLSITTTHHPATDLGYLLHKHPGRVQSFSLACGKAHVFYPESNPERCTACLLLDIDPIGLVRGQRGQRTLDQYVNDRPYVASSMLAVAIAQVFGTALAGNCKDRPALVAKAIPLEARIPSAERSPDGHLVFAERFKADVMRRSGIWCAAPARGSERCS